MSAAPGNDDYASILAALRLVRARWFAANVVAALLALLAVLLLVILSIGLAEGIFHLPIVARWALLALGAGLLVAAFLWVVRPLLVRHSDAQVARYVESRHPAGSELRNALINSVQLASDNRVVSPVLADRAVAEAAQTAGRFNLAAAVDYRPCYRRLILSASLGLLLGLFVFFFPGRLTNALARVLHPNDSRIAIVGALGPIEVSPGDAELGLGEPFEVHVRLPGRAHSAASLPDARIEWLYDDGRRIESLNPESADSFSYRMDSVQAGFRYCAWVGDSRSEMFTVKVSARPFVALVDLTCEYPAYTRLTSRTETNSKTGAIEAPEGATVLLTAHPNRPVARAEVRFSDGARPASLDPEPNSDLHTGRLRVPVLHRDASQNHDLSYSFYLEDRAGHGYQETALRPIRILPDKLPSVSIVQPTADSVIAPGGSVELAIRASDDFGLSKVVLMMKRNDENEVVVKTWDKFENPVQNVLYYKMAFDAAAWRVGEVVAFHAQAFDNCALIRPDASPDEPTFQAASSNVRTVSVRDPASERKRLAEDVRNWQTRVDEILKLQTQAQARVGDLKPGAPREDFLASASAVVSAQTDIQAKTATLVVDMESLTGEVLRTARTALAILARNEMTTAIAQARKLAQLVPGADLVAPQTELLANQARIVKVLTDIMGVLPAAVAEQLAAAEGDNPTSMTPDAARKWQALADKLKDFVKEEKKVIEDTNNLLKKNVDDYTEADKEKLKELAATQDDWAKFLKEAFADLSKVPNQDLANASLLKELLSVVTDVEKAEDALTRKTAELAVPLEQSGVENATELTTHIEKWLPDVADRLQWKMEEPIEDLHAPMAELPKELEDIVGDLMEQEEDLLDEAEDTSSAWADSIDKGAGWEADDGPISNMSAQGVTGNQLPNSSEIGGRSGEGRTGKSSGEMVGDEAVGKGGRRTPTRLTSDPYEKGEVKDSSTEGAGGATGGGKLSGAGQEGLEGPVPPPLARKMQRLAGQQADLRNQAERVQIGFKVLNYPHADVDNVVTVMKQVEDDLRNYRYHNSLRQRTVLLKGIESARLTAKQALTVKSDPTATLPREIQKEILDSADLAVPPEYEELVKKYYESLAKP